MSGVFAFDEPLPWSRVMRDHTRVFAHASSALKNAKFRANPRETGDTSNKTNIDPMP